MAVQGAYVGLSLAVRISGATGMRRRLLLAGAASSLAVAIWTMHFIGMLAARPPFQVDYLVFPTLLSFLVCVIVVGIAVYATSSGPLTMLRLTLSACLMGGGIFSMHYIGMSALSASAYMIHDRIYVAASMAIAIAASGLALWLAAGRGGRPPLILSSIAFGIAVSGMHYTAMEGLTLLPFPSAAAASAPALSTDLLAIVVAVVAFCLSAIFLLLLVPDPARSAQEATAAINVGPPAGAMPAAAHAGNGKDTNQATSLDINPEFGRGSYGPLGGAGAPPRLPRTICRSSAMARCISSPSMTSSRYTPMRITPIYLTAVTNCFVRSPSATSNRASTRAASSAGIAVTLSIPTAGSVTSGPAIMNWSSWMRHMTTSCR